MSEPTRRDGAMSGHRDVGDGALGYDTGTARRGASVSRRRYVGTSTRPRLDASAPTCRYQVPKCRDTAASRYQYAGQDGQDCVPVDWEGGSHTGRPGRDPRAADQSRMDGRVLHRPTRTGPSRDRRGRGRLASNGVVSDKACPAEDVPPPIRGGLQLGQPRTREGRMIERWGVFKLL